jgi:hypothetical protein
MGASAISFAVGVCATFSQSSEEGSTTMGMVYRQKGRTIWMMKYYRNGRPVVESSGTDDNTAAKKLVHITVRRTSTAGCARRRSMAKTAS